MSKEKVPKTIVSTDAIKYEKQHWSSNGTFKKKPEPGWSHKSQDLTGGFGVAYSVTFCGLIAIKKSLSSLNETKRTAIIRESILRVLHFSGIRSLGKKLKKPPKQMAEYIEEGADMEPLRDVNLIINSEKFLTNHENGKKIFCHTLNDVSFVATGVGNTADYIGYVSRDTRVPRACYVFDCMGNSHNIATTMTQAFEIKLKEMLERNQHNGLTSCQGMQNGGWADDHLYTDGGGSWNNTTLPPVPAAFDDGIYAGLDFAKDPLYDNMSKAASRGDQDIYDNRPDANEMAASEQGIYDNSVGNLGRREDGETEYDNCPKLESEDYLEGLLKQNIYDNNLRDKLPSRVPDESIYDNNAASDLCEPLSEYAPHEYKNITKHGESLVENAYEVGEPVYDNKDGERGDRELPESEYDNNPIQEKVPPIEDNLAAETSPAFGESPTDNCPDSLVPEKVDDAYTRMESVRRVEEGGIYDNVSCVTGMRDEENVYDLADDLRKISTGSNNTVPIIDSSIIISNDYDKLTNLYDLPNDNMGNVASNGYDKLANLYDELPNDNDIKEEDKEEILQIYDNALPNEQTTKPSDHDLATELIYDNNRLIDPDRITVLGEASDEFESNPVYGIPDELLSPIAIGTRACLFSNQLTQPKFLSPTQSSPDFDDGAIYSESIVTEQDSESDTKVLPVSLLPFFHHLLSRKDCEQLLQEEGDFLLRESQSKRGQYVISGLYQGKYQHLLFLAQNGKIQTKEREFPSISHLVAHYMETKELLSTGINNLSLITPITASFPDSSIYAAVD